MNPWKSIKGLPHDLWVLFFTSLINRSGTKVLPFLTLYLTKKFGTTPAKQDLPNDVTIVIFTFGEMIFFPVTAAYTSEAAPENRKGEYMGYYQMTFSFAFSARLWLATFVYQNYSSKILWNIAFAFNLVSA